MRHSVHVLELLGERLALPRREYIADIANELHDALRGIISELQMFGACRLERGAIDGGLLEGLHRMAVRGLQLRMKGHQVVDRLLNEWSDLGLLGVGRIDFNVEVLEHVINVSRDLRRAVRAIHHAVMPAAHGLAAGQGADARHESGA